MRLKSCMPYPLCTHVIWLCWSREIICVLDC